MGTRIQMIGNNEAWKGAEREREIENERVKKTGGDGLKVYVKWESLPFSSSDPRWEFFSMLLLTSVKNAAVRLDVSLIQPDEPSRAALDSWHSRAMTGGFKWHDSIEIKANIFSPAKLTRFFRVSQCIHRVCLCPRTSH